MAGFALAKSQGMRSLMLAVLLGAPLAAFPDDDAWRIGVGGSWAVPTTTPDSYHGTRQDFSLSGLIQREWHSVLAQLEIGGGGFTASNPSFVAVAARVGVFLRPERDMSVTVGPALVWEQADSNAECNVPVPPSCDRFTGNGVALSAELDVRLFPGLRVHPTAFAQILVPFFGVAQDVYPAASQSADGVTLALLGARLLF